eukprot:5109934-Prymnesium_polylepis.1
MQCKKENCETTRLSRVTKLTSQNAETPQQPQPRCQDAHVPHRVGCSHSVSSASLPRTPPHPESVTV